MAGWIKLYRSLKDWDWYDDINATRLLIHLLLTVNYENKKWKGIKVKAGSRITSFKVLADETGLSVKQVRTALSKLEGAGEVARKTTNKWQAVSLVKWDKLQHNESVEGKQQGSETVTQRATTKEGKENKEVVRAFAHLSINREDYNKLLEQYSPTQIEHTFNKIENYKKNKTYKSLYLTALNWLKKDYPTNIIDNGIKTEQDYKNMFLKD